MSARRGADLSVERLPVQSRPPYDCILDKANCPACSSGNRGNHGRFGGASYFAVRARIADGRHVVAELEVFRGEYPHYPIPDDMRAARGAQLSIHVEGDETDCAWMPSGRCDDGPGKGAITFTGASELYAKHGTPAGGPDQPDELWDALAAWLREYASQIRLLS